MTVVPARRAARGSNVLFVLACLAAAGLPGASSCDVRRALAAANGKAFTPGLYCWYFNRLPTWHPVFYPTRKTGVSLGLWERRLVRCRPRWFLTPLGLARLGHRTAG
mgnify:CR=1 FL=1